MTWTQDITIKGARVTLGNTLREETCGNSWFFQVKKTLNLTLVSFPRRCQPTWHLVICPYALIPFITLFYYELEEISPYSMGLDWITCPSLKSLLHTFSGFTSWKRSRSFKTLFTDRPRISFIAERRAFQMASTTADLLPDDIRHTSATAVRSLFDTIKWFRA